MATVEMKDVHKSFDGVEVIKGVTLQIEERQFAVLVGPSGCGKSTILRLIAGLEEIGGGDIFIDGALANNVPASKRGLAMVFQSYALYPHMTVAGNLEFSLKLAGMPRAERAMKVLETARLLQLESLLARRPRELSGGQRQRVAIGRALVRSPRVFLFDEPLSNLDADLRAQMRVEILRLHQQLEATTIYVTHDQVEAMTMADRIIVLHEGCVEQAGSPLELYHHPSNLFVARFIGSPRMNLLRGLLEAAGDELVVTLSGGVSIRLPGRGEIAAGEEVTFGIRPEHLRIGDDGDFRGEVVVAERLGAATYLHVKTRSDTILNVAAGGESAVRVHDVVSVKVNRDQSHIFDKRGRAVGAAATSRQ